jgi:hypothetical protein
VTNGALRVSYRLTRRGQGRDIPYAFAVDQDPGPDRGGTSHWGAGRQRPKQGSMYRHIMTTRHWLVALLALDALFIGLHLVRPVVPGLRSALFSITEDGGLPELYQYAKWFAIAVCTAGVAWRRHSRGFALWAVLAVYLLGEDALMLHERVGDALREWHPFDAPFGLRLDDVGELVTVVAVGLVFAVLFAVGYRRGSDEFRHATHDLAVIIGALGTVGVGMDMASVALHPGPALLTVLTVAEDGGEMLVASVMAWYALVLAWSEWRAGAVQAPVQRLRPALEEALGLAA